MGTIFCNYVDEITNWEANSFLTSQNFPVYVGTQNFYIVYLFQIRKNKSISQADDIVSNQFQYYHFRYFLKIS
jgi:hypothetical protein